MRNLVAYNKSIDRHDTETTQEPIVSIQVDEVQESPNAECRDQPKWVPWSFHTSSQASQAPGLRSTNASLQSLPIYYLASLTPPLLAAIFECVDLASRPDSRVEVLHRFYQLLNLIVSTKLDAYLDILEVVAYHTSKARLPAVSVLAAFWPRAVGHVIISKSFPTCSYFDTLNIGTNMRWPKDPPYAHQFLPWRFVAQSGRLGFEGASQNDCRSCSNPIHGFGLLCPFCMCAVHFDCYDYPEGSHLTQYSLASDQKVQQVAMYRFSTVLPNRRDSEPRVIQRHHHVFRTVNLFTLCLCFICRKPLWGCAMQGLKCISCLQFVHSACLSSAADLPHCNSVRITSNHMTIDWTVLRRSCIDYYSEILLLTKEELGNRSYEEISIFFAILWTQLQIMTNGVALGSIVIMQKGRNAAHAKEHKVDEFELQRVTRWCAAHLSADGLILSAAMGEYLQENRFDRTEYSMMFDWPTLTYISTAIKTPYILPKPSISNASDLLNVSQPDTRTDQPPEAFTHPFEAVSLSHMRDVLGHELFVHSDVAARLILSHMHHLGFFDRLDLNPSLFEGDAQYKHAYCTFPLPLGLDLSTDVETLVSAVEACLSDLDLSVNEFGFLLLVRKLWPNGLASEYASRRLTRDILCWILAEVTFS